MARGSKSARKRSDRYILDRDRKKSDRKGLASGGRWRMRWGVCLPCYEAAQAITDRMARLTGPVEISELARSTAVNLPPHHCNTPACECACRKNAAAKLEKITDTVD